MPPGLVFSPTHEELFSYLKSKLLHLLLPSEMIVQADVYHYHPKNLTDEYQMTNKYCEWFFFTWTTRKHTSGRGSRASRRAGSGRWKATKGIEEVLNSKRSILGWKQKFSYMEENPSSDGGGEKKTSWLMEEYSIHHLRKTKDSTKLDEWVICKIYLTPKARRAYMPRVAELEAPSSLDIANYSHIVQQQEDDALPEVQEDDALPEVMISNDELFDDIDAILGSWWN